MSKHVLFRCTLVAIVSLLFVCNAALGWNGGTHSGLTTHTIQVDNPFILSLMRGLGYSDDSITRVMTGSANEPPGNWHAYQYWDIHYRAYVEGSGAPPSQTNNWSTIDDLTRLKYLMHNAGDVGVPIGHNPASLNNMWDGDGYTNKLKEFILETRVDLWPGSDYPSVAGTSVFTLSGDGSTYSFTGTIRNVVDTFYLACRDNMRFYKNGGSERDAGWNGLALGKMLQRAVLVDYLLSKYNPPVFPVEYSYPGILKLSGAMSHDMDNIVWESNGTYSYTGTGITQYAWDLNQDGIFDYVSTDSEIDLHLHDLLAMGWQYNQTNYYTVYVRDDEYKWGSAVGDWFLSSGGLPEPATVSLLAVGGLGMLIRRKK